VVLAGIDFYSAGSGISTVSWPSVSCWERENPPTGPAQPKRFPNGSPSASEVWQRLFDSGSSVGGATAPFLALTVYFRWRWRLYHTPLEHPRIDEAGRQMILADVLDAVVTASQPRQRWAALLNLPQTWGTIVAKGLTDPV